MKKQDSQEDNAQEDTTQSNDTQTVKRNSKRKGRSESEEISQYFGAVKHVALQPSPHSKAFLENNNASQVDKAQMDDNRSRRSKTTQEKQPRVQLAAEPALNFGLQKAADQSLNATIQSAPERFMQSSTAIDIGQLGTRKPLTGLNQSTSHPGSGVQTEVNGISAQYTKQCLLRRNVEHNNTQGDFANVTKPAAQYRHASSLSDLLEACDAATKETSPKVQAATHHNQEPARYQSRRVDLIGDRPSSRNRQPIPIADQYTPARAHAWHTQDNRSLQHYFYDDNDAFPLQDDEYLDRHFIDGEDRYDYRLDENELWDDQLEEEHLEADLLNGLNPRYMYQGITNNIEDGEIEDAEEEEEEVEIGPAGFWRPNKLY